MVPHFIYCGNYILGEAYLAIYLGGAHFQLFVRVSLGVFPFEMVLVQLCYQEILLKESYIKSDFNSDYNVFSFLNT